MIPFVETPTSIVNEEDNLRGRILLLRRDTERMHDRFCKLLQGKVKVTDSVLTWTRSIESSLSFAESMLRDVEKECAPDPRYTYPERKA